MIETERLILKPLNAEELRLTIDNPDELDRKLGLKIRHCKDLEHDEHLCLAYESRYKRALEHPDSYFWYTNWNLIHKSDSLIIGGIMIMAEPDEQGEVEIGYGIDPPYQNKGYMTEAVEALVKWAFKNPTVKHVIAETEKDNLASHMVLEKNKFGKYKETTDEYWWRLENDCE